MSNKLEKILSSVFDETTDSLRVLGAASGGLTYPTTVSTITTATTVTLTTAQILGGIILEDPSGGAVTVTTPTAAALVAAVPGVRAGDTYPLLIRNTADAAETITVAGGSGVTISGTATIAQNNSKLFLVRFTTVTSGSEAVTVYSVGTFVH